MDEGLSCPIPATVLTGILTTGLCAITLGSKTAFTDLAGSFIILSTSSYALAIAPNLWTRRAHIPRGGPFRMGAWSGYAVNGIAVVAIVFFDIMYCFPYALPTTTATMNYNSVILAGVVAMTVAWWFVHATRRYVGPKVDFLYDDDDDAHGHPTQVDIPGHRLSKV